LALAYVQRDGELSGLLDAFDKIMDAKKDRWARQAVRELRQALRHHPDPAAAARAAAFQIGHQWRIGPGRRVGGLGDADLHLEYYDHLDQWSATLAPTKVPSLL
jgi:hypothetical protein